MENHERKSQFPDIRFISYDYDEWGALCEGTLTVEIDGKRVTFGDDNGEDYPRFWQSGGSADVVPTGGFWKDGHGSKFLKFKERVVQKPWLLDEDELPESIKPYAAQLLAVFNENAPWGCCGYCL